MRLRSKSLKVILFALMFLFSCSFGNQFPDPVLQGVEDRAIRTLRTDPLGQLVSPTGDTVELRVVEVTLSDRSQERRAFLTLADGQFEYLGPLAGLQPGDPLEYLLFEINGSRFVAVWIGEDAVERPSFATLERPRQLSTDDSMRVLSTGEVINRVGLLYLPADEARLWDELTAVRITGRGVTGYAWETDFAPPLNIAPRFTPVNLP